MFVILNNFLNSDFWNWLLWKVIRNLWLEYSTTFKRFAQQVNECSIQKNFTGPDPPKWRFGTPVAYFKDRLYYLGGKDLETRKNKQVDVRRSKEVHIINYSGFNRWKMANRIFTSNWSCSSNNMQWNFIRSHYSIFVIVIMDIQLLVVMKVERYIDYQTMNGNGLK